MESVYGVPPDLAPFADLVICHELTHLADLPSWLDDPSVGRRGWGDIAPSRWAFQRLNEMYDSAAAPGMDGTNYVWFEFRLQIFAKRLWAAAGAAGFRRLNTMLRGPVLPDEEIFAVLGELDRAVADDLRRWQVG
jgi:hypothetical protein